MAASLFTYNEDDFKEAMKGAERGEAEAQLSVGIMYDFGQGVPQNYTEALKWYTRSANQGNARAQNNLGILYLQAEGTPQNFALAAKWIQLSANQGYATAEMNLGFMFADGNGVIRNPVSAIYWLRKAAEQGDATTQRKLGEVYSKGDIVSWDFIEAYKWYVLAAAQGDADATKERDELAPKMSPQAINEAQQRAAAFVPTKPPNAVETATGSGTGFFVTQDGYMLTAYHVIDGAAKIVVKTKYLLLAAKVVKVDKTNDVALLKITGAYSPAALTNRVLLQTANPRLAAVSSTFRPLKVSESSGLRLGDSVSTIGFPNPELQGSAPKFTRGEINSLAGFRDDPHRFQISAQVQPGNSGGPLLDKTGSVVGLVQSTLNDAQLLLTTGVVAQNVNYALKSEYLLRFLKTVPGLALNPPVNPTEKSDNWVSDSQSSVAVVLVY
jgi:S1-C subfamily serine protease